MVHDVSFLVMILDRTWSLYCTLDISHPRLVVSTHTCLTLHFHCSRSAPDGSDGWCLMRREIERECFLCEEMSAREYDIVIDALFVFYTRI